ncbi:S41 family peptidase [Azospirillum sp. TSO35-2]|uniref:S41 family peptidase n=1 Tax=Azospirillum sp. TSO35-2 TaxID=716796 RepID=UPI000D60AA37|nr:S41 family peptidase [Azospirillum sp. TSO35-2]PWC39142.1 peptidase S41 [Azospirillum sp. TSO35-2]
MRMIKRAATAAALVFLGAGVATVTAQSSNSSDTYRQLNLFGDVFERVRAEYVEPVTDEQLIESAINGMLTSLDPHSSYLNKKSFQDMQVQTRGEFGGLGIEVTMENGLVKVVSPIDDTPAFRAGLQPGDLIVQLNGDPVMGLSLNEAVEKMRGPIGSELKVTVRRGEAGEPFTVSLTRAVIKVQSVRFRTEGDIGYVRITSFNEQTQSGLEKAIASIQQQLGDKLKGYVLDLRNNPGGLLDQAVSVSDTFLDKGEIVSTRGRKAEEGTRFNAKPGDLIKGLPLVVLINGGSASASEIVAGALQDHKRAIVMGTQSFGKGSVQTIIPLPGHGAMRLTTARYYTPSGRSIQQLGITPDIEVHVAKVEDLDKNVVRRREADLKGALVNPDAANQNKPRPAAPAPATTNPAAPGTPAAPNPGAVPGATNSAPGATPGAAPAAPGAAPTDGAAAEGDAPPFDFQLARALDLLRGVALFQQRSAAR